MLTDDHFAAVELERAARAEMSANLTFCYEVFPSACVALNLSAMMLWRK